MSPANGRLKFAPGLWQSRPRRGRVPTAPKPAASDSAAAWSPCRVNQNMDKEWPHELALTCLGHQVTIVRLGEQVTHTRPAAMLQNAMWGRGVVVADLQLAAAGSRLPC